MPGPLHEAIVPDLAYYLRGWAREHDAGRVLASGYKVRISEVRGVMPDLQLLSKKTWQRAEHAGLEAGRPELAVELISPSSRRYDRVVKLRYYAGAGVPEYWIVDPEARTVERLVLREGGYVIAQTASGDETFEPEGWDGLAIPLAELWGDD